MISHGERVERGERRLVTIGSLQRGPEPSATLPIWASSCGVSECQTASSHSVVTIPGNNLGCLSFGPPVLCCRSAHARSLLEQGRLFRRWTYLLYLGW